MIIINPRPSLAVEPISIVLCSEQINISLRGSIAESYYIRKDQGLGTSEMVFDLIYSLDPNVIRLLDGRELVIGLKSDAGHYFPHW
jgi:hypothetical protein